MNFIFRKGGMNMRKYFKNMLILAILVALLAMPVFGGGSKESAAPETNEKGQVVVTVWSGYPDNQAWLDWVTAEFEKENPDIDMQVTTFPISDFETKVAASIPAGSCADIITINPSYVYAYNSGGRFAKVPQDLQDLVRSGIYDEAVVQESSYEGEVVAVPHMLSNAAWFYNKDYFEEAGITDVPTSMEEVLDAASKLVKYNEDGSVARSGISLRLTGAASGTAEKWWVLLMQYGGKLLEETEPGMYVASYNDEAGLATMKFYFDALYGIKADDFEAPHDTSAFLNGDTAMFARESSVIVEVQKNSPALNYGTFPMFNANIAITKSWYVLDNGSDAKEEAAWKYIEFVNRPENMIQYHLLTGYQPARKDLPMEDLVAGVEQRRAFFEPFDTVYTYVPIDEFQEILVRLGTRLTDAYPHSEWYGDDAALQAFLDEAAAETNSLLKENGHFGG